jgi:hypothetical protein
MTWTRRADRHARLGQWERSLAIYDHVIGSFEPGVPRSPAGEFVEPLGLAPADYDEVARGAVELARARILELVEEQLGAAGDPHRSRVQRLRVLFACCAIFLVAGLAVINHFREREVSVGATWMLEQGTNGNRSAGSLPSHVNLRKIPSYFFHSAQVEGASLTIDLGQNRRIKRVLVANRTDCCQERAKGLEILASLDGSHFTLVARDDSAAPFDEWNASLTPRTARFVRLRLPRKESFHLSDVRVFGR